MREEIEKRRQSLSDHSNMYVKGTMLKIIWREQVSDKACYSNAWLLKINYQAKKI